MPWLSGTAYFPVLIVPLVIVAAVTGVVSIFIILRDASFDSHDRYRSTDCHLTSSEIKTVQVCYRWLSDDVTKRRSCVSYTVFLVVSNVIGGFIDVVAVAVAAFGTVSVIDDFGVISIILSSKSSSLLL